MNRLTSLGLTLGLVLFFGVLSFAQTPASTGNDLSVKIDKVLQNQQLIFKRLDEIKEELAVIQVRATR